MFVIELFLISLSWRLDSTQCLLTSSSCDHFLHVSFFLLVLARYHCILGTIRRELGRRSLCHSVREQAVSALVKVLCFTLLMILEIVMLNLSESLHSDLNVERVVAAVWRPRDCAHSECSIRIHLVDSGILLTLAARVLIADTCSVTTTASDDVFSIPTNALG